MLDVYRSQNYDRIQDLDKSSDRENFKSRISMPMSSPNPYANIEDDAGDWSHTVGGGYQVPSEQAELRYDGGKGSDF